MRAGILGSLILLKLLILLATPSSTCVAATIPEAGSIDESFVFPQATASANAIALLPSGGFIVA